MSRSFREIRNHVALNCNRSLRVHFDSHIIHSICIRNGDFIALSLSRFIG